jgi:parallel beta-helix repeat protein
MKHVRVTERAAPGRSAHSLFSFVLLVLALVFALAGAAPAAQAAATTWYVSPTGDDTTNDGKSAAAPFKTIGHAISVAVGGTATTSGDTVLLADGTYTEHDLDYGGKAITVRSASDDPTKCILDCQQKGRGFYFQSDEKSTSVLQGITITNGNAPDAGGGLRTGGNHTSPTITHCTFTGNTADYGGGMYNGATGSNPTITNCTFTGNTALGNWGGGGMYNVFSSSPTIANCTFSGNSSKVNGGGMLNDYSSHPTLTNCTFTGNTATGGSGGGMYNSYSSSPTLTNCVLWGDTGAGGEIANSDATSGATITDSDVQGLTNTTPDPTTHNFGADPQFVRNPTIVLNADDTVNLSRSDFGDLHLKTGSPCIDKGSDAAVTVPPFPADSSNQPLDLDGHARIVGAHVDLGAYEYAPPPDTTPPSITATANKTTLWPPTGQLVPVKMTGTITDNVGGSGVDLNTVDYAVVDEYGQVQPSASVTLAVDGSYSFTVYLPASRLDSDRNGRTFTICVSAKDNAGNPASKSVVVTVPHDMAGR